MAKNAVSDWDTTAANNTDIGGIGIQGSSPVSNFDNAFREMMAQVAAFRIAGTFPGNLTSSQNFQSSTTTAVFATTGAGTIVLRPNGSASAVGQLTMSAAGNIFVGGGLLTTAGLGYSNAVGAGGTVTQATSKATTITLNTLCGTITLNNSALAAGQIQNFTFLNSNMAATDVMIVNHTFTGTIGGYTVQGRCIAAGQGAIDVRNNTAGSLSEAIILQYAIIKGANS